MAEIKHVGRIKSTNKKCVVAYRTLPGDAYNCLIVPTESIPDAYHDSLLNLVESNAAQTSYELAEALARTNFPDGTIMLSSLHALGKLVKVPTDQVEMLPAPGVSIQLDELNQLIAAQRGIPVDELSIKPKTEEELANEPDPYTWNIGLDVRRYGGVALNEVHDVEKSIKDAHFAIVLDFGKLKKSGFEPKSDIMTSREEAKKGSKLDPSQSDEEIKKRNITRNNFRKRSIYFN